MIERTEGVVLGFLDLGEEDRLVTVLTPQGLLKAAAGGARKLGSGRTASLDLFARLELSFRRSSRPGKLPRLGSVKVLDPFLPIREDYPRLCAASFLAEVVSRSAQEGDPNPRLYRLVLFALRGLAEGKGAFQVLLPFEVRFLREMGWVPELFGCLACGEPVEEKACFSVASGGVVHYGCRGGVSLPDLGKGDLAILRFLAEKRLDAVKKLRLAEDTAARLFGVVHPFTRHHLGFEPKAASCIGSVP